MPIYEYVCEPCDVIWDNNVAYEQRDSRQDCPSCGGAHSYRRPPAPAVMRASYHSGYRRGAAYAEGKEIAKLKVARADLPVDKRSDINKEIAERSAVASKKRDKTE